MSQKCPKNQRLSRIIELRVKGYTLQRIADELGVDRKTIYRDIQGQPFQEFVDEMIRQQLADIISSENVGVRLNYRDKLLDKFLPKKFEGRMESKVDLKVDAGKEIAELLRQYEELFKSETVSEDNTGKQVDSASSNN